MKKNKNKIKRQVAKVGHMSKLCRKSKKFYCDTDQFINVAGDTYNLYKFFT